MAALTHAQTPTNSAPRTQPERKSPRQSSEDANPLYAIPRTSILGAMLLTGYLGGAVCAHFRAESPLLSTTLFPVYVGIAVWAGLYLRDEKVRALIRDA